MQVKSGDRVVVHGLSSRPELNGQSGTLLGAAANGRATVKLDSGVEVSLKPDNLGVPQPGSTPTGGMPNASGMPGFGGGMPGFGAGGMPGFANAGMPNVDHILASFTTFIGQLRPALERHLTKVGVRLPSGLSDRQLIIGCTLVVLVMLYFLSSLIPLSALLVAGALAFAGTKTHKGRVLLEQCTARASATLGRPLPSKLILAVACITAALVSRSLLGSSSSGVSAKPVVNDAYAAALREAYQQGYDDAVAGLDPRPPKHIAMPDFNEPSRTQGSSAGFFGGSFRWLFRLMILGPYAYRLGQGPGGWNPAYIMANLKANPGQVLMMLMMMSGGGLF